LDSGKTILITGGCGFIGSHTALDLLEKGFNVVSIDNLSRSKQFVPERIKSISGKNFINYKVDLRDLPKLRNIMNNHQDVVGIIHFAAFKSVGESTQKPLIYFDNNLNSTINILRIAEEFNIPNFVFSSSCSVYGNTSELPVAESTPTSSPESPYGWTKLISEQMIASHAKTSSINFIALRYFNPVGAHTSGRIGEIPFAEPENLVPNITQTAIGKKGLLTINGFDYPTKDGSCVRDYVHVMDIAEAHTLSLEYQLNGKQNTNFEIFNLGSGNGVTVLELINAFEQVSNTKLNYVLGPRRDGDVVAIYADNKKAADILHWKAKRDLHEMMDSAWKWEQQLQNEQL
jgi:UDP-glucose 4-epimerase